MLDGLKLRLAIAAAIVAPLAASAQETPFPQGSQPAAAGLATSDWAVVAVALISAFFAWLATFVTNRRAAKASEEKAEAVAEPSPGPSAFALDIRDGVMEIKLRLARVEGRVDVMTDRLDTAADLLRQLVSRRTR